MIINSMISCGHQTCAGICPVTRPTLPDSKAHGEGVEESTETVTIRTVKIEIGIAFVDEGEATPATFDDAVKEAGGLAGARGVRHGERLEVFFREMQRKSEVRERGARWEEE